MKLSIDCMRDVMLELEKMPSAGDVSLTDLCGSLPQYSFEDINYTCLKLAEAKFIHALVAPGDDWYCVQLIDDITYEGHQFLATIRSDDVWEKTKKICSAAGVFSVNFIIQVAGNIFSDIFKPLLSFL